MMLWALCIQRARPFLAWARRELTQAERINDESGRRAFLQNPPWNRRIMAA
jgi:hypothetical protein